MKKGNGIVGILIAMFVLTIIFQMTFVDNPENNIVETRNVTNRQELEIKKNIAQINLNKISSFNRIEGKTYNPTKNDAIEYFIQNTDRRTENGFIDINNIAYEFECDKNSCVILIDTNLEDETNTKIKARITDNGSIVIE
ncbi:MAG: hypothetical protein E7Z91_00685 [Cyanobacteria bacterium SIG30]|nr:hypothetical protein [Cyanobacteria bacterium SIG30]